jgi:diketogulonate reductase-like aldo/keto reductase
VEQSLAAGYRHIDTAAIYANESGCGGAILESSIPREEIFYVSKLSPKTMGYDAAKMAIDESLSESGLEYLDLYLIHAPFADAAARNGSWKALAEAVVDGKIRSIGLSNYGLHHLKEFEAFRATLPDALRAVPVSVMQYELHPWMPRRDIVSYANENNIVLQAYGPVVLGKKASDPTLVGVAKKHGKSWAQVLLRWSIQKGYVPLPKSVTSARISQNIDVFDFELDSADMAALETDVYEPNRPHWDPTAWGFFGPSTANTTLSEQLE